MKAVFALAMLLVLGGCSSQQSPPAASIRPVPSTPHVFSATDASENTVAVPPGAKSAEISVTCSGSEGLFLSVTVGSQDQPRSARCPSTIRFRVPAGGRSIDVSVVFAGGTGRYVGQVRFSAEHFVSDHAVATQCAGMSGAFSDIASAQNGRPNGPLDLAGWQGLMASATEKLKAIDDTGALGTQLTALIDWYGRSNPTPDDGTNADADEAFQIVKNLCLDNGTPLVIVSQYGA